MPSQSNDVDDLPNARDAVAAYKSCEETALCVGLFGRTGCGKTSLINSLKFAVSGRLRRAKWLQVAAQEKAGGHTMFRRLADITPSIYVIDNRGLDDPSSETAMTELAAQLNGERGFSEKVEWQERDDPQPVKCDALSGQPIGCAVLVFSALHDIENNTDGLDTVVDIIHGYQGRYPVSVITHVDVACNDDVTKLKEALQQSGLTDIYEVASLTKEKMQLECRYQHSLLAFLKTCTALGDDIIAYTKQRRQDAEKLKMELRKKEEEEEKRKRREDEKRREREREEQRRRQEEERQRRLEEQRRRAEEHARWMARQQEEERREMKRRQDEERRREEEREAERQRSLEQAAREAERLRREREEAEWRHHEPDCIIL